MLHTTSETASSASAVEPNFGPVVRVNNRLYVWRSRFEQYKAELMATALGRPPVYPPAPAPDVLVPVKQAAAEVGIGRRSIGRRIRAAEAAARGNPVAAE